MTERTRRVRAAIKFGVFGVAAAQLAVAGAATAGSSLGGKLAGSGWTAASDIVGQTSTATVAGGGNPIYLANSSAYSGVVTLIINEGAAGNFICTGSLLGDRETIVTAGHCVSHGAGKISAVSTTAYFNDHSVDTVNYLDPNSTAIAVRSIHVNPKYTGEVIDDNDVAVLKLAHPAPAYSQVYSEYNGPLDGQTYNVAGFGLRSDTGGAVGATPTTTGVGRLRQGLNTYSFAFGDPAFGGFFAGQPTGGFFGTAETTYTEIAGFYNGDPAHDSTCLLAGAFGAGGSQFCGNFVGPREVSTAPGDSGGPEFVDGKIASVTSFGLTFGTGFGDVDNVLNDSFGELNGFAPLSHSAAFIAGVPEPASWAMMIAGFGLIGLATRRNRGVVTA